MSSITSLLNTKRKNKKKENEKLKLNIQKIRKDTEDFVWNRNVRRAIGYEPREKERQIYSLYRNMIQDYYR